jgi:hypothetical protein
MIYRLLLPVLQVPNKKNLFNNLYKETQIYIQIKYF